MSFLIGTRINIWVTIPPDISAPDHCSPLFTLQSFILIRQSVWITYYLSTDQKKIVTYIVMYIYIYIYIYTVSLRRSVSSAENSSRVQAGFKQQVIKTGIQTNLLIHFKTFASLHLCSY